MVKPLTQRLIKGFVSELRSRYVFFVFRDSNVLCIHVLYRWFNKGIPQVQAEDLAGLSECD